MGSLPRLVVALALLPVVAIPAAAQDGRPGWIGVSLDLPVIDGRVIRDSAVIIGEVRNGSPAAEAGLRRGDRLVRVANLSRVDEFGRLPELLRIRVGDRVPIRVERDGRRVDVVVRATERPSDVTARRLMVDLEPDSAIEIMVRAMDSLRVQLVRVTTEGRLRPAQPVRVTSQEPRGAVSAPFEFFVFRGEEHDSLERAMEHLNRLTQDLRRREAARVAELRRATRAVEDALREDDVLSTVRSQLEQVTRETAALRTAMSEAATAAAGFDYTVPSWSQTVPTWPPSAPVVGADPRPQVSASTFSPLTPYLLGSNMVAGAQVIDLRPDLAEYFDVEGGVLVVDVAPGTPAAISGMQPGDVIVRLDQVRVRTVEELRFGVSQAGEALPISLVRRGGSLEVLLRRR
jgi:membrane-associated protease RseP (regulator of RpoE activity)